MTVMLPSNMNPVPALIPEMLARAKVRESLITPTDGKLQALALLKLDTHASDANFEAYNGSRLHLLLLRMRIVGPVLMHRA